MPEYEEPVETVETVVDEASEVPVAADPDGPQAPSEDVPVAPFAEATEVDPTSEADSPSATEHVEADAALAEAVGRGLTWIPYAVHLGLWLALAGVSAYLFKDATPENPARWMPEYATAVWVGVGLAALGPLLSIGVWLVARTRRPRSARRGLFASALIRGAVTTFFGVVIWLATLYVLELVATGALS